MRIRVLSVALIVLSLAVIAPASGSELVQDPNAALLSLRVNMRRARRSSPIAAPTAASDACSRGVLSTPVRALVDYRRCGFAGLRGRFGESLPQREVLGKRFKNRCRPYDGPSLPMLVAACKAPNGSYWLAAGLAAEPAARLRPVVAAPVEHGAPPRAFLR